MKPGEIATVAAAVTAFVSSLVPVDVAADRQAHSWVQKRWFGYRAALTVVQLGATAILGAGAVQVGWSPRPNASGFSSTAQGIAWAVAAMALLRADFTGFRVGDASPGFSLLRSLSEHLTGGLRHSIAESVRAALPNDVKATADLGHDASARAFPPREDGTASVDGKATDGAIALLVKQGSLPALREFVVRLIVDQKLKRFW
jgi:hypothetical protein